MLQRWTSEGEFYIRKFVNSLSRLCLCVAHFIFALYKKEYLIGRIFIIIHIRKNVSLGGYLYIYT